MHELVELATKLVTNIIEAEKDSTEYYMIVFTYGKIRKLFAMFSCIGISKEFLYETFKV